MSDTALRNMVREAIAEGVDVDPLPVADAERFDPATDRVMKIIESVHENALAYGQLVGEERVLDALIEGRLAKASQRHWWEATKQKIKAAQEATT